jgi:DNA-binding SARP family transcriptional activator
MHILHTKLIVPRVKDDWIRRVRLAKKMKAISRYPLTLIHSGAGYGKSTALALYVTDSKCDCCWYSISSSDDDVFPFLTYLVYSIRTKVPSFGVELIHYMNQMDRYIRDEELNSLCSLFVNEIHSLPNEMILIIDDFHQVEQSFTVNRLVELLLEHIPTNLHLVISSRSRPSWKCLTKMKVSRDLLELTKSDFMLKKDEIELLLNESYQITLPPDKVEEIYHLTEGWVIALGMIAQQATDAVRFSSSEWFKPSNSLEDLFQYLALEVFANQPPFIQQFLEQTSIFEEISEENCDEILGIKGSKIMIEQLLDKNLFIQQIGEQQYKYHALFKEFLEKQLQIHQPQNFQRLHERSARYFERTGLWEEAIGHYEKIRYYEGMASLLSKYGDEMLDNGKLEGLKDRLDTIPSTYKNTFTQLWFLEGEVYRFRSQYKQAEDCYDHALLLGENSSDLDSKRRALVGKAKIYLDTIQPYQAERLLYQAIELNEQNQISSEEEIAKLYKLLAENFINSGQALKAERWIARAKQHRVPLEDGNLEARLLLRTGRLIQAKAALRGSKNATGYVNDHQPLPQSHRETDLLLSLLEAFTGNGKEAKYLAQEGIQYGMRIQSPFVEACGWIRMGHAVQLIDQYESSMAIKCYETSLEMMDRLHVDRGKAEPLMGLCILYGRTGDYERAIEIGRQALLETDRVKDLWLSSLISLAMSLAFVYQNHFSNAINELKKTLLKFEQCGDEYGKMLVYFWVAYISYKQGDLAGFTKSIDAFIKRVQVGEYEFFFKKRTTFGPQDLQMVIPLLLEAQKQEIAAHYVTKILQEMSVGNLDSHPGYTLRIQVLGKFKAWLGDQEVEERGWQREKAKELLQLFVSNRQLLLTKDEIFSQLWPDQAEKSAARDFKVALNALNNVLEPNRKARAHPFFIVREGTSYGLNTKAAIEIDSVLFENYIQTGLEEKDKEKSIPYLEKGLNLYKGDYLIERRYNDWCINEREKLLVLFLRGAEKLAQLSVRSEEYDQAIAWCERILKKDRTWEEAYRLLMYCYYRKNNRPYALRWYEKCCETLENELGVPPLEPTQHMYDMIVESEKFMQY